MSLCLLPIWRFIPRRTPIELVKCRMQVQMMNMSNYMDPPSARNLSTSAAHVSKPTLIFSARTLVNGLGAAPAVLPSQNFTSDAQAFPPPPARGAPPPGALKPEGLWKITSSLIRTHGLRGLWLGHTGTMLRETGGSSIWFSTKEWAAARLRQRRQGDNARSRMPRKGNNDLLPWESALAGALAGAVSTLLLYPADTVKSAVQTEGEFRARSASSQQISTTIRTGDAFLAVTRRMYATNGFKGFYTGCGMTVARSAPGSAILFLVYDGLSAWLG